MNTKNKKPSFLGEEKIEIDENFLKASDFESITMDITMKNITTNTEIKKNPPVRFIELLEKGLILEVPIRSCAEKHHVMFQIKAKAPNKNPVQFNTTAMVTEKEPLKDGYEKISISLVQYEDKAWRELNGLFSTRQDEIDKFFKMVKE